jgi:hypothetical protein
MNYHIIFDIKNERKLDIFGEKHDIIFGMKKEGN